MNKKLQEQKKKDTSYNNLLYDIKLYGLTIYTNIIATFII